MDTTLLFHELCESHGSAASFGTFHVSLPSPFSAKCSGISCTLTRVARLLSVLLLPGVGADRESRMNALDILLRQSKTDLSLCATYASSFSKSDVGRNMPNVAEHQLNAVQILNKRFVALLSAWDALLHEGDDESVTDDDEVIDGESSATDTNAASEDENSDAPSSATSCLGSTKEEEEFSEQKGDLLLSAMQLASTAPFVSSSRTPALPHKNAVAAGTDGSSKKGGRMPLSPPAIKSLAPTKKMMSSKLPLSSSPSSAMAASFPSDDGGGSSPSTSPAQRLAQVHQEPQSDIAVIKAAAVKAAMINTMAEKVNHFLTEQQEHVDAIATNTEHSLDSIIRGNEELIYGEANRSTWLRDLTVALLLVMALFLWLFDATSS